MLAAFDWLGPRVFLAIGVGLLITVVVWLLRYFYRADWRKCIDPKTGSRGKHSWKVIKEVWTGEWPSDVYLACTFRCDRCGRVAKGEEIDRWTEGAWGRMALLPSVQKDERERRERRIRDRELFERQKASDPNLSSCRTDKDRIVACIGRGAFNRLVMSVLDTNKRGKLRFWQEELLERLRAEIGISIDSIDDYNEMFGSAKPIPPSRE